MKCESSDTEDPIHFDFFDENGFIELVFRQEPPPGWSIKPMIEPCKVWYNGHLFDKYPFITQLWQNDIDMFGSCPSSQLPSCQFLIHTDNCPDTLEYLVYPVEVKGITPLMNITIHRKRSGITLYHKLLLLRLFKYSFDIVASYSCTNMYEFCNSYVPPSHHYSSNN